MPDPLTHAELDAHIRSLTSVGGIYEPLAEVIEHYNRPHCVEVEDERTSHGCD